MEAAKNTGKGVPLHRADGTVVAWLYRGGEMEREPRLPDDEAAIETLRVLLLSRARSHASELRVALLDAETWRERHRRACIAMALALLL